MQVVINYELPADATDYIHRIGRTARAGRGGLSISIVTERDIQILLNIEEKTSNWELIFRKKDGRVYCTRKPSVGTFEPSESSKEGGFYATY